MGYGLTLFCTLAVVIQIISGQCLNKGLQSGSINGLGSRSVLGVGGGAFGNLAGKPFGRGGLGRRSSGSGGRFAITSASPVPSTGVSVLTDTLAIEGPLDVGGNLPFRGSVAVKGTMPNAGTGAISYGCGNGNVGITEGTSGPGTTPINLATAATVRSGFSPSAGLVGPSVSSLGPGLRGLSNLGLKV